MRKSLLQAGQSVRVRIHGNDSKVTEGEIRVQFWDKKERTTRALKFGGLCLGASVVSLISKSSKNRTLATYLSN